MKATHDRHGNDVHELTLYRCDKCGAQLYGNVNGVSEGELCLRQIVPVEYEGMRAVRQCDGRLRKEN